MTDMPTEANKKAAVKAKVRLTRTVNGKRVKKTREELLKNIENKKAAPVARQPRKVVKKAAPVARQPRKVVKKAAPVARQPRKMSLREKRYRAFLNRYKYENYPYIGDDLSEFADNYAGNKKATLENYKIALKNAENEARRNYGN